MSLSLQACRFQAYISPVSERPSQGSNANDKQQKSKRPGGQDAKCADGVQIDGSCYLKRRIYPKVGDDVSDIKVRHGEKADQRAVEITYREVPWIEGEIYKYR